MHVHTETVITAVEVIARIQAAAETDAARTDAKRKLRCEAERVPPKVFLSGAPIAPPAGAEVNAVERSGGTDVVLRMLWGPLPALVPRALTALGALIAVAIIGLSDRSVIDGVLAFACIALPLSALLYQHAGERAIQERLNDVLQGSGFTLRAH